ncbi:MAG: hypothetical protein ABSD28_12635 [Tepidisphaeraceae bacterium]
MTECANCGRKIGNLESPQIWQGHTVCTECLERLSVAQVPPANYSKLSRDGIVKYGPVRMQPPGIFKVLAWLLVIIIVLWAVNSPSQFINHHADTNEEILHNGQGP